MAHIDLTTRVGSTFVLANPFWIASAHYSENEAVLKQWRDHSPAAITLKTCTKMDRSEEPSKRSLRIRTQSMIPRYGRAYYCDGPKTKELKSYEEAANLLGRAKNLLGSTKIGISVLATEYENYSELRQVCSSADFWELNLKYSMRTKPGREAEESFFAARAKKLQDTVTILRLFLDAFKGVPVFVKMPRELEWLPSTQEATTVLDLLSSHGNAGLIVANSRKADLGEFIHQDAEQSLTGGVLCGDPLYDSSLTMIRDLRPACAKRNIPIVASGGMVDEQQALMAMRSGADAVQLCTAFDYHGLLFYQTLVAGLTSRIKWRGLTDMSAYILQLRNEGVASIFSIPFGYSTSFWADEFQKQIKQDIRLSKRMDFVIISGRTLYAKWDKVLTERVEQRFLSVRALHLNPDSAAFAVVQNTWGIAEPGAAQAHRERLRAARAWIEGKFARGKEALKIQNNGDTSDVQTLPSSNSVDEQGGVKQVPPSPEWGVAVYDKCPFYSMYIFDDKAHVAMYPFMEPGDGASPVYTYPRSSNEYDRLATEFDKLWRYAGQTTSSGVESASADAGLHAPE